MPHPDQRFCAAWHQCAGVDLLLVPQLKPAGLEGFGDVYRRAWRRLARKQHGNAVSQAIRSERRWQDRQQRQPEFGAELPGRGGQHRVAQTDRKDLSIEAGGGQQFQDRLRLGPFGREAEHDEVGSLGFKDLFQVGRLGAFEGDETKFLQRVGQKCADMPFAICDTSARRQSSLSKRRRSRHYPKTFHGCSPICEGSFSVTGSLQLWNS